MTTFSLCLTQQHDLALTALAVLFCCLMAFASINLFRLASEMEQAQTPAWLFATALILTCGVWTTHFVACLAYQPGLPISYNAETFPVSLLASMTTAWVGFTLAQRRHFRLGGAIIGVSIAMMHYISMASVKFQAEKSWDLRFVALSVLVGMTAAGGSMAVFKDGRNLRRCLMASLLIVLAICGTHFLGMAALTLKAVPGILVADGQAQSALLATALAVMMILIGLGLLGSLTERRLRTQALEETRKLRRSQDHLERAQKITQTGSVERDLRTGEIELSSEIYRIFSLDPNQPSAASQSLARFFHPDDHHGCQFAMRTPQLSSAFTDEHLRLVTPEGAIRWLRHEAEFIYDEAGTPIRWIATYTDVTRIHEAEDRQRILREELRAAKEIAEAATQAVLSLNDKLEHRVMERTAELVQAQEDLLKKERLSTIGQLTATVAHELRNPLGAIKNTVFTLKELSGAKNLKLDRPIARMERSVDRCNSIITHLLEYSRVSALKYECHDFDQWLVDVLDELAVPPTITVERVLAARDRNCAFDPERLRQVIVNLVENAIHALNDVGAERPEKRLRLSTRQNAGTIELTIADTGPGIAAENLTRVFDPLFSTKSFGTGLGLPAVKQIVEQHGGTITLASTLGQGTEVTVVIPHERQELAA